MIRAFAISVFLFLALVGCDLREPLGVCNVASSYTINLTVRGFENSSDVYTFEITDSSGRTITKKAEWRDGVLTASIEMPLNSVNSEPRLTLRNESTDSVIYSSDLTQTISDAYAAAGLTVDFNNVFDYDVALAFDSHMGLTITVNGWSYYINSTQLDR